MIRLRQVLLCFLVGWVLAACPAAFSPPDIQSGVVAASITANNDIKLTQQLNSYSYVLPSPFYAMPAVAIATTYLDGPLQAGQSYFVTADPSQQSTVSSILFTVNVTANGWSTIRFSFMASTRQDFELNQLTGDIQSTAQQFLSKPLVRSFQNPTVIALLSGIAISSITFGAATIPLSISIISKQIVGGGLQVGLVSNFASTVTVGYVVYSSTTVQLNLALIVGESRSTVNVNPQKLVSQLNTFFYGVSEIVNPNKNVMTFEARLTNSFNLQISSRSSANILVGYLLVENLPQFYCTGCSSGSLYDGSGCVAICSGNAVAQPITNTYSVCRGCPIENYMIQDLTKSKCVCADQTYPTGPNSCLPCHYSCASCNGPNPNNCLTCDISPPVGTNRYLTNGQCPCVSGYYDSADSGSCLTCHYSCFTCNGPSNTNCMSCNNSMSRVLTGTQCPCNPGYIDDGKNSLCQCQTFLPNGMCSVPVQPPTIICPLNSANVNNICQCNDPYINSSNTCITCPNNSEKASATECRCKTGFVNISGQCTTCPANSVLVNGSRCQCSPDFVNLTGVCSLCPPNNVKVGPSTCQCKNDSVNISGVCTVCPTGSIIVNNQCQCPQNTLLRSGACQPCPQNSQIVGSQCRCLSGYANISGQCTTCPFGSAVVNGQCQCPANSILIGTSCVACPPNSAVVAGQCQCLPNFVNASNNCIACPPNSQVINNRCQCIQGFNNISGQCVGCPTGGIFINGQCQCASNSIVVGGACTPCSDTFVAINNQCKCPVNSVNASGRCDRCPDNSIIVNNQCRCNAGSFRQGNICLTCSTGQYYNGSVCAPCSNGTVINVSDNLQSCQCNPGYFSINGVCGQCPANESYASIEKICVCIVGYRRINGVCTSMTTPPVNPPVNPPTPPVDNTTRPPNTVIIGGRITCAPQTYNMSGVCRACSDNENLRGNVCTCKNGFALLGSYCAKLGDNEELVDGKIVCRNGFFNVTGVCERCRETYNPVNLTCECPNGYVRTNGQCRFSQGMCPPNSILRGRLCACAPGTYNISGRCTYCPNNARYNGVMCVCNSGLQNFSGICRCPDGSYFDGRGCTCNDGYISTVTGGCAPCPTGAIWDGRMGCVCSPGYTYSETACIGSDGPSNTTPPITPPTPPTPPTSPCGPNANFVNGRCECNQGFVISLNGCVQAQPGCPPGSQFIFNNCVCNGQNTVLINGACRTCPSNSYANGQTCVCYFGSYRSDQNTCVYCNPPSTLMGVECRCPSANQVYIFDACYSCHQSCATCNGTNENQCLSCPNQSMPVNGACSARPLSNCPNSTYFSTAVNGCQSCIPFCTTCQNSYSCFQCLDGFTINFAQCVEVCGDGKRFQLPCDDGNQQGGDGCSVDCQIEQGWTCSGGSPLARDFCGRAGPVALKPFTLSVKDIYHVNGIIVISVALPYIPDELRQNSCVMCPRLLISTVLQAQQQPIIQGAYTPPNAVVQVFSFNREPIQPFRVSISVNPQYRELFKQYDLGQPLMLSIDPALIPITG